MTYEPFKDDRGTIQDLLRDVKIEAVTQIDSVKGAIRGNHYHEHTTQWTYIVMGRLFIATRPPGQPVLELILMEGQVHVDKPNVAHAWKAERDTVCLVFTQGPRSGDRYEDDVVRLEEPLLR